LSVGGLDVQKARVEFGLALESSDVDVGLGDGGGIDEEEKAG
jgi:hypothetical protein